MKVIETMVSGQPVTLLVSSFDDLTEVDLQDLEQFESFSFDLQEEEDCF